MYEISSYWIETEIFYSDISEMNHIHYQEPDISTPDISEKIIELEHDISTPEI